MDKQAQAPEELINIKFLKASFQALKKDLEKIKMYDLSTSFSCEITKEVGDARIELYNFFNNEQFTKLCCSCQEDYISIDGKFCCFKSYGEHFYFDHLIYCAMIGFNFPEPDWSFLKERMMKGNGNTFCLFCSLNGCLLRENKRGICFNYTCDNLKNNLDELGKQGEFNKLNKRLKVARSNFAKEALNLQNLDSSIRGALERPADLLDFIGVA